MNQSAILPSLAALLLAAGGCGGETDGDKSETVIRYDAGVRVTGPEDTDKLKGAPQDFKTFIASAVEQEQKDADTSCDAQPSITVKVIDPSGYATGDVTQCEPTRTIWRKSGGKWAQLLSQNSLIGCDALVAGKVPISVAGKTCHNGAEGEVPYEP